VVSWLTDELVSLGYDVTLFASGESRTREFLPNAGAMPVVVRGAAGRRLLFICRRQLLLRH
jgi:hypothetical protein